MREPAAPAEGADVPVQRAPAGRPAGSVAAQRSAQARREQLGSLLKLSPQPIAILDADGDVREWNPAAVDLLGHLRDEVLGRSLRELLSPTDLAGFDALWAELPSSRRARVSAGEWLLPQGRRLAMELLLAPIQDRDGVFAGVVVTMRQLSPPEGQDPTTAPTPDRPTSVLEVDELTGLLGRRGLDRLVTAPLAEGDQRAVAVLDLDAFALVNQDYGPDAGDELLRELGRRLVEVGELAVIGRWQADEFVCVVDGPDAADRMAVLVERIASAVRQPFSVDQEQLWLSVSAGVATSTHAPPAGLLRAASAAMSEAKRRGRDCAVWFSPDLAPSAGGSGLRLANDLHRGVAAGELRLHYQPIVDLATNDVAGVEALVRWQRPGVGLLSPAAFIEVAERTGLVVALGTWVVREACRTAAALAAERLAPLPVSINVSARQLSDPDLVAVLEAALAESGCTPSDIVVEVTESAVLRDLSAATAVLETIAALGVDLDLDDFGTGYSSLLYLKHFPVSRIKIDASFVAGLGVDVADTAIVASTIALAHSIGLTAVAEGVETPDQLTTLRQMGCDYAQGFLLCHPLPAAELAAWLSQRLPSRLLTRAGSGPVELRDRAGDARDHVGDVRDGVADRRELLADERERAADLRDDTAELRDDGTAPTLQEVARRAAAAERVRATADRQRGVDARSRAAGEREVSARERREADRDRLTGAHLLETGTALLEDLVDQAHRDGTPLTVAALLVRDGTTDQLDRDAHLVVLANALGDALRDSDLLVRHDPAGLLCALPGLGEAKAAGALEVVSRALTGLPELGLLDVRLAQLRPGETAAQLVERVR